ncbi:hypothetical protein LTR56_020574 [Elasticomyces elasticus]|nr:hypothetical protein LTR56_020574 [Elasticomyces elasticus]KAK4925841.1 hypothetical protein LTR49_007218 [Elasticomyces elasticus]KAK5764795.1 hypothetical protein LTS12_005065 [Elasticomyces elasticus]
MDHDAASPLAALPNELLLEVATKLNISDLFNLGRTSHQLHTFILHYEQHLSRPHFQREHFRICQEPRQLDFKGLSVAEALRRYSAAEVKFSGNRLNEDFISRCFAGFYKWANPITSTHLDLSFIVQASFRYQGMAPAYSRRTRKAAREVGVAAKAQPFWPASIKSSDPDMEFVGLSGGEAKFLGLPYLGRWGGMTYACCSEQAYEVFSQARRKVANGGNVGGGDCTFEQAKSLELIRVLPLRSLLDMSL